MLKVLLNNMNEPDHRCREEDTNIMRKATALSAVAALFVLLLANRAPADLYYQPGGQQATAQLDRAAEPVIRSIELGDLKSFIASVSDNGLIVVRRSLDYDRTDAYRKGRGVRANELPDLRVGGPDVDVRESVENTFAKSEFGSIEFRREFKMLSKITKQFTYPCGTTTSLNLPGPDYPHYVGPAIGGKMASNYFWYVCFVREHNQWRVWKIEVETTH